MTDVTQNAIFTVPSISGQVTGGSV